MPQLCDVRYRDASVRFVVYLHLVVWLYCADLGLGSFAHLNNR